MSGKGSLEKKPTLGVRRGHHVEGRGGNQRREGAGASPRSPSQRRLRGKEANDRATVASFRPIQESGEPKKKRKKNIGQGRGLREGGKKRPVGSDP